MIHLVYVQPNSNIALENFLNRAFVTILDHTMPSFTCVHIPDTPTEQQTQVVDVQLKQRSIKSSNKIIHLNRGC